MSILVMCAGMSRYIRPYTCSYAGVWDRKVYTPEQQSRLDVDLCGMRDGKIAGALIVQDNEGLKGLGVSNPVQSIHLYIYKGLYLN